MNQDLNFKIKQYEDIRTKIQSYSYLLNIVYWDSATVAPMESYIERGNHVGLISEELYKMRTSKEFTDLVDYLYDHKEELDIDFAHEIEIVKEDIDQTKKIPMNEIIEYEKTLNVSQVKWEEAKHTNDFSIFMPYLEKIVEYKRKEIKYLETETLKGYDVLLNMYERGYTQKEYNEFFNTLKEELVPFVKEICAIKKEFYNFEQHEYPIEKQKQVAKYMGDVLCFDFNRGTMAESEHPFTWNTSPSDVRITNHFYLNDFSSSLFSAIHEFGHATYEQGVDRKYDGTFIAGGVSMAMHESQSRFYENIIGRDYHFWEIHFPKLKEIYNEQFKDVTLNQFYEYINKVEASFIRTEADELTYPLHVMLRYELEQLLFEGDLEVKDLEKEWNKKIKDYFNLEVPCSSKGVLQDSHWSGGSFGYFPTYALGSAIASQLYEKMNSQFNVNESLENNTTKEINNWLNDRIHKYGSSKYPKEILESALNEKFNVRSYINYLKNKYSRIYNVKIN